jgi:hypothetical protein
MMVRLIWVDGPDGNPVQAEDAPTECGHGHRQLGPKWGQCPEPTCRVMVRLWKCLASGCDEVLVDDEHVHRAGPMPPGVHAGG